MKTPRTGLLSGLALALLLSATLAGQTPKIEFPRPSPTANLRQRVGITDIDITYSRPGVKNREIFGGDTVLVPYGQVWRTGANEATKISFSTPVTFGGMAVPAGDYALFSIPGPAEWTVILNRAVGQWGAYQYDAKNDVARVKAAVTKLNAPVETFTIDVNDVKDTAATLNLTWADVRATVPIQIDTIGLLVPKIDTAMAGQAKLSPGFYDAAAMFYFENNLDLAKAMQWEAAAIAAKPDAYYLHYHQARILAKAGDKAGAQAAAKKSIELAASDTGPAKDEYLRLNNALLATLGQ